MALTPEQEQEMIQIELELRERQSAPAAPKSKLEVVGDMAEEALLNMTPGLRATKALAEASPGKQEFALEAAGGAVGSMAGPVGTGVGVAAGGAAADLLQDPQATMEAGKKAARITLNLQTNPQEAVTEAQELISSIGFDRAKEFLGDRAVEFLLGYGLDKGVRLGGKAIQAVKNTKLGQAFRGTGSEAVQTLEKEAIDIGTQQSQQTAALKTAKSKTKELLNQRKAQVTQAAQEPVQAAQEALKQLPAYQQEVVRYADEGVMAAKQAINNAEEALGIGLKDVGLKQYRSLVKNPETTAKFVEKYSEIANKFGSEGLARSLDLKTLQTVRKAAENAAKNTANQGVKTELFQIQNTFRQALNESNRLLARTNNNFKAAIKAKEALPAQFNETKKIMELGLKKAQNLAKNQVLNDQQIKALTKTINILERKGAELPARFAQQKAVLNKALVDAKALAAKQASMRKWAGVGFLTAAAGGAAFTVGQRALDKVIPR